MDRFKATSDTLLRICICSHQKTNRPRTNISNGVLKDPPFTFLKATVSLRSEIRCQIGFPKTYLLVTINSTLLD